MDFSSYSYKKWTLVNEALLLGALKMYAVHTGKDPILFIQSDYINLKYIHSSCEI